MHVSSSTQSHVDHFLFPKQGAQRASSAGGKRRFQQSDERRTRADVEVELSGSSKAISSGPSRPGKPRVRKVMKHNENKNAAPQPAHPYYQTSKLLIDVGVFDHPISTWAPTVGKVPSQRKGEFPSLTMAGSGLSVTRGIFSTICTSPVDPWNPPSEGTETQEEEGGQTIFFLDTLDIFLALQQ
ncbi:hypothetical protein CB1_002337006 [Camelus ferus]|nr:hypothetical protein CB1_002337006 [Camelus ferus]